MPSECESCKNAGGRDCGVCFWKQHHESMLDLQKILDDITSKSRTAKLWVNCFIRSVLTILKYVQTKQGADWALHLTTVRKMIPLFFTAGHMNYARYALYYMHCMEEMPSEVHKHFMDGEHTVHHKNDFFNGMYID